MKKILTLAGLVAAAAVLVVAPAAAAQPVGPVSRPDCIGCWE
ncbi:hypothetical protein [Amycolatopsis sp. RTGN1]|nr:hypothetical protein [Amycolatopsis sp. RTGN1]